MVKRLTVFIAVLLAALISVFSALGQMMMPGQVIDVIDGKTMVLAISSGKVKVELQYVEVPEPGQALYETVRTHLRNLVLGKRVDYRPRTLRDDRMTGLVRLDNVDLSQQLLRDGAAWHIPSQMSGQDTSESDLYASIEAEAKKEKLGIWAVSDMKPAWEFRAEKEQSAYPRQNSKSSLSLTNRGSYWADKNPKLANIGALFNGYNAKSRNGFVSTSYLPIRDLSEEHTLDARMVMDITYWYKEEEPGGRRGIFVFTLVSESDKYHFLRQNDLILSGDGKTTNLGKPKRTVTGSGENLKETLAYTVSKAAIERMVSAESAYLKIGRHTFWIMNGRYLLFNMLDAAR